ncbi:MAG: acyl carrier protein [Bryobacteraceae bacterium]
MHDRIQQAMREVFDNDNLVVTDDLSVDTFPDWDSLSQVKLIIALQEEFGVTFQTEEVLEATSVGKLKGLLASKGVAG